ncbi:hypothetical protein MMC17_003031 [Xylographa soralifera]|nr:hypothetical protein [Xylographa soralifera]
MAQERNHGIRINTDLLEHDSEGRSLVEFEGNLRDGSEGSKYVPGLIVYGHVGTIKISWPQSRFKVIKLGFDFDFNPVCFLVDHSDSWRGSYANDRSGVSHWVGDWEFTTEERPDGKTIYDRYFKYWLDWSKITPGGTTHYTDGGWAFRGDRLDGFLAVLVSSFMPYWVDVTVSMRKETENGQMGWVFELESKRHKLRVN